MMHKSQEGGIVRMTEHIVEISGFLFSPLFDLKTSLQHEVVGKEVEIRHLEVRQTGSKKSFHKVHEWSVKTV